MEFLIGRSLSANLVNLGLYDVCREAYGLLGLDWKPVVFTEPEAGLGNGGLGRLAACLMDSLATVGIAGWGYGIRYDYGMFRQRLDNGEQVEEPDDWARHGTPWEFVREKHTFEVQFGGRVMHFRDAEGRERHEWVDGERVLAVGCDQAVSGYLSKTMNTIRLARRIHRAIRPAPLQHRRLCRRGAPGHRIAESVAHPLSRRFHPFRQGVALQTGVFLRLRLA